MKTYHLISNIMAALVVLCASSTSIARGDVTTVTVTGYADAPDLAVTNALVEAVRQTGGVSVSLDPAVRRPIVEWTAELNDSGYLVSGYSTSVPEPQVPTVGGIQSYRIDDLSMMESGTWKATVTADALQYKRVSVTPATAPTLVIEPFTHGNEPVIVDEDGATLPMSVIAERLQHELTGLVASSGSYRLLDRRYAAAAERESTISAASLNPQEQLKRARALGADVLLVGDIERVSVLEHEKMAYGDAYMAFSPRFTIVARMIEVATGEIISTSRFDHVPSSAERARIRQLVSRQYQGEPEEHVFQMLPAVTSALMLSLTGNGLGGLPAAAPSNVGVDEMVSTREVVLTPGSSAEPIVW